MVEVEVKGVAVEVKVVAVIPVGEEGAAARGVVLAGGV